MITNLISFAPHTYTKYALYIALKTKYHDFTVLIKIFDNSVHMSLTLVIKIITDKHK